MISYRKLWSLLNKKGIGDIEFCEGSHIHVGGAFKNLKNNKDVSTNIIDRICKYLECQPGDIMEYVPDEDVPYISCFMKEFPGSIIVATRDLLIGSENLIPNGAVILEIVPTYRGKIVAMRSCGIKVYVKGNDIRDVPFIIYGNPKEIFLCSDLSKQIAYCLEYIEGSRK